MKPEIKGDTYLISLSRENLSFPSESCRVDASLAMVRIKNAALNMIILFKRDVDATSTYQKRSTWEPFVRVNVCYVAENDQVFTMQLTQSPCFEPTSNLATGHQVD